MRVPLSWLRDYVDFDLAPEALAERLTLLGMEVGAIEQVGADWSDIVVGELLEVAPHPNTDRLSLTRVRVADGGEPLSIVCGATNIAVGQRVPVALPGAVLPGERRIEVTAIAGVTSAGMLCSGDELGLTADAEGILILAQPGAADGPAVGRPLADVVGDTVLDIDVKPNRGDALSLIGLAREVAAIGGGTVRWPAIEVAESGDATTDHVSVEVEADDLCPRFVARYVDGLRIGDSPLAAQLRLSAAGLRPVSNVVDASNYVMLELGKPIHTFDAAAVADGRIVVRRARAGETIETLDHVARELSTDTLLIADSRGPIGIAGVMGGTGSEISPATSAVIIESAVFDPVSIRRTAHRYGLRSEASSRFEKGQESRLARVGADRTAQLIAAWAGGRVARDAIDTAPADEQPRRVSFRPARIDRLLGSGIAAGEMRELLSRVEIATEAAGADELVAVVPPHRRDIEIEADVAEEIARLYGYEQLAPRLPDTLMPVYRADPRRFEDGLRDLLAGRGLVEVVTTGLISPDDHARLGLASGDPATLRAANPVSVEHSELRRSLLPGLVGALAHNERQRRDDVTIFEIGAVHELVDGEPWEADQLGLLLAGSWSPLSWTEAPHSADFADAKGLLSMLAERLGIGQLTFGQMTVRVAFEHPGRTARVLAQEHGRQVEIGRVGELDPRYMAACGVRAERAAFALLDLPALARLQAPTVQVGWLAQLPAVERDIAVVVRRDQAAAAVEEIIRREAGSTLARLTLFDRYSGPPLAADQVSLAYRLRLQPREGGLSDEALDEIVARTGGALAAELGARIRGGDDQAG
jgi:phenylalanyl-tRNA synthetase beta chain